MVQVMPSSDLQRHCMIEMLWYACVRPPISVKMYLRLRSTAKQAHIDVVSGLDAFEHLRDGAWQCLLDIPNNVQHIHLSAWHSNKYLHEICCLTMHSILPSQQHILSHTLRAALQNRVRNVFNQLCVGFLQYAHLLLAVRGAASHDAQGFCNRLHATSCSKTAEPDLMVPPAKVCATFSAFPEADQQRRLACPQQLTTVLPLRAGLSEAPKPATALYRNSS